MLKVKIVKTSYGKLKKLVVKDASYLAGLIDGEGSISLDKITKGHQRRLSVSIGNTDLKLLEWVKKIIGAGQISRKKAYHEKHSPSYVYRICNRQAFNLLAQIHQYIKIDTKRKRSELVLKNYIKLTPRNGKYSPEILKQRNEFIKKFFSIPYSGIVKTNPRNSSFIEKILKN